MSTTLERTRIERRMKIEPLFDEFVRRFRGELVRELLPKGVNLPRNADYLLFERTVVAELKSLEENYFNAARIGEKMTRLANKWIREGQLKRHQIRNGRFSTSDLPPHCADEALKVLGKPIHKALTDANKQIKQTKAYFNLPNAIGLIILANDGNFTLTPSLTVQILSLLFRKHFSAIESFVYIAPNLPAHMPGVNKETRVWLSGTTRDSMVGVPPEQLHQLSREWVTYIQSFSNEPIDLIDVDDHSRVQDLHFTGSKGAL